MNIDIKFVVRTVAPVTYVQTKDTAAFIDWMGSTLSANNYKVYVLVNGEWVIYANYQKATTLPQSFDMTEAILSLTRLPANGTRNFYIIPNRVPQDGALFAVRSIQDLHTSTTPAANLFAHTLFFTGVDPLPEACGDAFNEVVNYEQDDETTLLYVKHLVSKFKFSPTSEPWDPEPIMDLCRGLRRQDIHDLLSRTVVMALKPGGEGVDTFPLETFRIFRAGLNVPIPQVPIQAS